MKKVIIIGAGPSGIMAALYASMESSKVILIDKNNVLGKKLLITGGGRCNLTSNLPLDDFYSHITGNKKFLFSAFNFFGKKELLNLFEKENIRFKTEGDKIYPVSDRADDILAVLEKLLIEHKIDIRLNEEVTNFVVENAKLSSVKTNKTIYEADSVIICTGGCSYPATGSDGKMFKILKEFDIKVTSLYPALVSLKTSLNKSLAGISLNNVELKVKYNKKEYITKGAMLFTHTGISGPAVLDLSSYISSFNVDDLNLYIDFLPEMSLTEITELILDKSQKNLHNRFKGYLPMELIKTILPDLDAIKIFNLKKSELNNLVEIIKIYNLKLLGFGKISEGIITKGGIDLKGVNSSTLESKLIKGLYFAGEVLDLDANTGGFNLQIAFSTGALCGYMASQNE